MLLVVRHRIVDSTIYQSSLWRKYILPSNLTNCYQTVVSGKYKSVVFILKPLLVNNAKFHRQLYDYYEEQLGLKQCCMNATTI